MNLTTRPAGPLQGSLSLPGDKSISHRALLLSALAEGTSRLRHLLVEGDCRATLECLKALGVPIEQVAPDEFLIAGRGMRWSEPESVLDCAGSGTTMRLLCGLLAGQPFFSVLNGNAQLRRRPMGRVVLPLQRMGARIEGRDGARLAPLAIQGGRLRGVEHRLTVASAQVKSCLLLAGLYADGVTTVVEPALSRDHTERMLAARGIDVGGEGVTRHVAGPVDRLQPLDMVIPGDLSSAAFLIVAAILVPGSMVTLQHVGVNPTRTGLLEVLAEMGAAIEQRDERVIGGEPVADLVVRSGALRAVEIGGALIPRLIDELPILALAATQAEGITRVRDAAELRVKETDRVHTVVETLRALGARIEPRPDGFEIVGPTPLRGVTVDSWADHRLAMMAAVAGLIAQGETSIARAEVVADSYPGFVEHLHALTGGGLP